jgi:hypothetical protein
MILEVVFRWAPGPVKVPGECLGAGLLQVRDDKARVDAWLGACDLDHHAA